ncbi:hypothetical protein [Halomicronema sp. CCY15110]|uniref:hypothetical protein n=1 Tax=Halomicronema sp. CCY15110 TaxID=2767773 RepID=UPI0019528FBB|nr:hypothetical protein [Halomicronema sp. CCY15110]
MTSAACLGTLSQVEVPLLAKPFVLLLPLQTAALAYVIWYWRDRSHAPTNDPSSNPSALDRRAISGHRRG